MRSVHRWFVSAALVLLSTAALAGGNCNFLIGSRALDNDQWDPVSPQVAVGVDVDLAYWDAPIALAFGAHGSAREKDDITYAIGEVSAGVLWKPKLKGAVHPYIGVGLANVTATITVDTGPFDIDDDDSSLGYYANAGVYWRLGKRFNLGFDARLMRGTDGEVLGVTGDADYFQAGLVVGFGWGK